MKKDAMSKDTMKKDAAVVLIPTPFFERQTLVCRRPYSAVWRLIHRPIASKMNFRRSPLLIPDRQRI